MKKLIPAICMTLIAAFMLASSTFAWFSMNTQVTATGMQVVSKSDNTYLLIGSTNNAEEIQTGNKRTIELKVEDADAKVYPCAPATSDTVGYLAEGKPIVGGGTIEAAGAGVAVTNDETAAAHKNWYTATAADPGASTIKDGSAKQLATFDGYVIVKTVYLTVAAGANDATNLTVTPTITTKGSGSDLSSAHVIVTTSDGGFANLTNAQNGTKVPIQGSHNLTDDTVLTVNIYIYIDGNDTNVYTNNAVNLAGANISLAFDVTAVAGA